MKLPAGPYEAESLSPTERVDIQRTALLSAGLPATPGSMGPERRPPPYWIPEFLAGVSGERQVVAGDARQPRRYRFRSSMVRTRASISCSYRGGGGCATTTRGTSHLEIGSEGGFLTALHSEEWTPTRSRRSPVSATGDRSE